MAHEITMPKLSDTMTEGRLISWKKGIGERVERGDIIAEVETDKANMELEAFTSGTLLETRVNPGGMAPVGTVIAIVGEAGEAAPAAEKKTLLPPAGAEKEQPPPAYQVLKGKETGESKEFPEAEEPQPLPVSDAEDNKTLPETEIPAVEPAAEPADAEKASPMVRRLAREQGVELRLVKGSGPDGRILQEDLEHFLAEKEDKAQETVTATEPESQPLLSPADSLPLSRMRAAIARTVSRAWQEIPHFSVTVAVDMGEAEEVRRELKESGTALSINDLIIKAAAMALARFPQANNSFAGDRITVNSGINIGIAVGLEDGLVVPVIKGCGGLSLKEIATRSRELVERAKGGKISEAEISGGTFSISNLGMFGVDAFTAVIQPPQGAILAVGAVRDEAVARNGLISAARIMRITLSADHRLIDGAYAAQFLQELKRVLESPVSMLV
jgi:pyruvate dehydrogenase E2 component (dihydrolipoamide acetyltransferase)